MVTTCRHCEAGFHDHCTDIDPGTACPCQCPEWSLKLEVERARDRIQHHRRQIKKEEAFILKVTGGAPTVVDPLARYRTPADTRLGRQRLELAMKEMYGT